MFTAALVTKAKTWKQPNCSLMDEHRGDAVYKYI